MYNITHNIYVLSGEGQGQGQGQGQGERETETAMVRERVRARARGIRRERGWERVRGEHYSLNVSWRPLRDQPTLTPHIIVVVFRF